MSKTHRNVEAKSIYSNFRHGRENLQRSSGNTTRFKEKMISIQYAVPSSTPTCTRPTNRSPLTHQTAAAPTPTAAVVAELPPEP